MLKIAPFKERQDCMQLNNGANKALGAVPPHRKECQRADWPAHKADCKKAQATQAMMEVSVVLPAVLAAKV
jgi:hypothetical protein